jgi:hypothetical protein
MKKLLMIFAVVLMASPAAAQLVITGLLDGPLPGGVPKLLELYACDDIADLSVYGIGCANNGGGTDGVEYTFPADAIAAGSFIYCEQVSGTTPAAFMTYMGFASNYDVGFAAAFNGDDAIELFYVGGTSPVVVDVFGDINLDGTGTGWDHLDGWAKRSVGTGPDGSVPQLGSWTFSGVNATDGCLTNDSCGSVFPVGGYSCNPAVSAESESWGALKSLFR